MTQARVARPSLLGDVGGTNCRLALIGRAGEIYAHRTVRCADYLTFGAAVSGYLAGMDVAVSSAVVAVAGPVRDGMVSMTNHPWRIAESELAFQLGGVPVKLVNDFAALALAAPALGGADLLRLGPSGVGLDNATIAVVGAGTGFGAAALVRDDGREVVLVGEGGHVAFAPQTPIEEAIWRILMQRFRRVSVERVLSGPGLLNLHQALCELEGHSPEFVTADAITAAAEAGNPGAIAVTETFCAVLGAVAGDLALAYGARGGVLIAGGVSQKLLITPAAAKFRDGFEAKWRLTGYMAEIPTSLIVHPYAALVGAARVLPRLTSG